MKKKITIATSAYRCEPYLEGYLENMAQLTNREEIVIQLLLNDPSNREREMAFAFQERLPELFRVQCTARETIGASINRGWREADTPFLSYADVDDRRPADAFERQLATLEQCSSADFTYGDFVVVKQANHVCGKHVVTPDFDPVEFTRSSCVGPGHFFRRELLLRAGYFDEQLRSGADFDFQVRAAFNGRFQKTSGIVAYYLMDNRLPSASKTPWQRIDACVIYLRYGVYDKVNYDYVAAAASYHMSFVLNGGQWIPIQQLVPNYDAEIRLRNSKWARLGIKNYLKQKRLLWRKGTLLGRIFRKVKRDGIKEAVRTARQWIEARRS